MRLFRLLPGPRYLVPFFYNLMSTSPGPHKHNLEKRVPGKIFRQAHTVMPCVLLCGFPCSGKTTRANQLKTFLIETSGKVVHVINDDDLKIDKNQVYSGENFL